MTTDAPNYKADSGRGYRDGFKLFARLNAKWPKGFPLKSHLVRPLANGAQKALMEEFGWSPGYARGVLAAWKARHAYCQAVLLYPMRIHLDGSASGEEVDDLSRENAKQQLEQLAVQKAKREEKEKLRQAAKKEAEAAARAEAESKAPAPEPAPPPAPPPAPEPPARVVAEAAPEPAPPPPPRESPKSGKLIVVGSAAMQAALQRRLASGSVTTEVLKTVDAAKSKGRREHRAR
jgi:sRNA-binding protein